MNAKQEIVSPQWDYSIYKKPTMYGSSDDFILSYKLGMAYLKDCQTVEDWGCGTCFAKQFCKTKYLGIDANKSEWTDVIADLRSYTSKCDGIFMRHVLEHNYEWEKVLSNAVSSFQKRMALIFFLPFSLTTEVVNVFPSCIPDITFNVLDILTYFNGMRITVIKLMATGETLFLIEK